MSVEKNGSGGLDAGETTGHAEVRELLGRLTAKAEPDASIAGQPYYDTPDGSIPIERAIWDRLDVDTVGRTVDQINRTLASGDELAATNGHLELDELFVVREEEKRALAEAAGSALVRDVVDLVSNVERVVTLAEEPGLPDDSTSDAAR